MPEPFPTNMRHNDIKNQNGSSTRTVTELHFQKYENLLSEKFSHQELNSSLLTFKPSIGLALTQNTLEYNLFFNGYEACMSLFIPVC